MIISIAARNSQLSRVQVKEVEEELKKIHSPITFEPVFTKTYGDLDQKTSLRLLGKTDFFTREVDQLLLTRQCRIGVHSAKDLPESIPEGLKLIALTKGLEPYDSLVMRKEDSFYLLKTGSIIATSSERREEAIKKLRSDFTFVDLRGTIAQRLKKLEEETADGVVVAEAALIRLNLTHLNRLKLKDSTVPYQGQLAIVARKDDVEMEELFACIHSMNEELVRASAHTLS